jgi:predicted MFS family arabinose efflux permease
MSAGPSQASNAAPASRSGEAEPPPSSAYANYVLVVVFLILVSNLLDRQLLAILVPSIQAELAVSDTAMGLLTGVAFALFNAAAAFPVARWADRGVRRSIIALGVFGWSALTVLSGAAQSFAHLCVARIGVGIAQTAGGPPVQSLLADYFPPERRATALAILSMGGGVGMLLAVLIGGWVNELHGWRWAFVVAGAPGLALALVVRFSIAEPLRGASERVSVDSSSYDMREVVRFLARLPSFRHLLAGAALHAFASFGASVWLPTFLVRVHGLGTGEIGSWLALAGVGGMAGVVGGGVLADRLGRRDPRWYMLVPALATLAGVPFIVLFLVWPDMPAGFGFFACASIVGGMWAGPTFAMVQGLAKVSMRSTAAALMTLATNLAGLGLGPIVVGGLSDLLTPEYGPLALRYALLCLVITYPWAAVHHWLASRTLAQDLRAKESV